MGREVRRVPAKYKHPTDDITGKFRPLFDGRDYQNDHDNFMKLIVKDGLQAALDYMHPPNKDDYMNNFDASLNTHFMMFEDTSEGTPISPAFETPEELARWLADNGASAFGGMKGTYEGWLRTAQGGYTPSMIISEGVLESGVDGFKAQSK